MQSVGTLSPADATRDGHNYAATLPVCVVALEACCGPHLIGRALTRAGQSVRFMSPEYVRSYVQAQKYDDGDAGAIADAAT